MRSIQLGLMLFLVFAIPAFAYVEKVSLSNGVTVDYSDPVSVVEAAKDLLFKVDYKAMLEITEGSARKKTENTLASIKEDISLLRTLKSESDKIQKFEVIAKEVYESHGMAVVYTKWQIKMTLEQTSGVKIIEDKEHTVKPYSTVYVDYLLQNFDGKWKIVSQKNK